MHLLKKIGYASLSALQVSRGAGHNVFPIWAPPAKECPPPMYGSGSSVGRELSGRPG